MMSIKEIKKLRQNAQSGKTFALSRDDDFNYRLHCKVERILNQILGEKEKGYEKAKEGLKKLRKFRL